MPSRRIAALLALPAAFTLAACSSSTSGKGSAGGSAGSSGATSGGSSAEAAALGGKLQSALAATKSAHIELSVQAAGQNLNGAGDEQLDNGKLVALDLTESLPGSAGAIRIIIVDNKTYAKLPTSILPDNGGKPYVLVTPDSSNATVRQLATTLDSALSSASVGNVSQFVSAAKSVRNAGSDNVNGTAVTHYSIVVDVSKLPASVPGRDELAKSGLRELPLELYVDQQNRPVQVTEDFKVTGQEVSTKVIVSKYDQPVSITAPPADQVNG